VRQKAVQSPRRAVLQAVVAKKLQKPNLLLQRQTDRGNSNRGLYGGGHSREIYFAGLGHGTQACLTTFGRSNT